MACLCISRLAYEFNPPTRMQMQGTYSPRVRRRKKVPTAENTIIPPQKRA